MDQDPVAQLLADAGYRVSWRRDGFSECLLSYQTERWRGVGTDEHEAFEDALQKAFPSALAMKLLRSAADGRTASSPSSRPSLSPSSPPARPMRVVTVPPPPGLPHEFTASERAPEYVAAEANTLPTGTPSESQILPSVVAHPANTTVERSEDDEIAQRAALNDALEDIHTLRKRIDSALDELALSTPVRQRTVMLGWISAARSRQEALDDAPAVYQAVAGVAQTLTGLCKRWWPGSVRALQVNCHPRDIAADIPVRVYDPIFRWLDAERVVEISLDELIRQEEALGRDAYGWADGLRLNPPPRDPVATQNELQAAIEQQGGPLGMNPARDPIPDPMKFLLWCRTLRWLRGSTPDVSRWGVMAGRLRWWAQTHAARLHEGARALEPSYCPDVTWSVLLGKDKKDLARRKLIKDVFQGAPALKDAPTDEQLIEWLSRSLPLSDTHHANIVEAMKPFRERVNVFECGQFPNMDRRLRRRLAALQRDLGGDHCEDVIDDPIEETGEVAVPEAIEDHVVGAMASLPAAMREAVVAHTEGRTALFVSNRNDPMLQSRLMEVLKFRELDWSECEPRRCAAIENTISAHKYDFVFGATGFFSHSVDGLLTRACRRGGVPYIRVDRGRPLACVRALSRELGLDESLSAAG